MATIIVKNPTKTVNVKTVKTVKPIPGKPAVLAKPAGKPVKPALVPIPQKNAKSAKADNAAPLAESALKSKLYPGPFPVFASIESAHAFVDAFRSQIQPAAWKTLKTALEDAAALAVDAAYLVRMASMSSDAGKWRSDKLARKHAAAIIAAYKLVPDASAE